MTTDSEAGNYPPKLPHKYSLLGTALTCWKGHKAVIDFDI
jgi:hypothetical protein